MKRDQLKELNLTDEQINAVMSLNGQDIEKAKAGMDSFSSKGRFKCRQCPQSKDL